MDAALRPLDGLFRLNTDLLINAVDGMTEAQALDRVGGATNHVSMLVAHLVNTRYRLSEMLGTPGNDPVASYLVGAKGVADVENFPSLESLRSGWHDAGAHLASVLAALTPEQLAAPAARTLPNGDPTTLGAIAFFVQHESYHLGQVAIVRRMLGLPAMSYRRPQ